MIWHSGFPLPVLGYSFTKGTDGAKVRWSVAQAISASVAAVVVAIVACTWVVTAWHGIRPAMLIANRMTWTDTVITSVVVVLDRGCTVGVVVSPASCDASRSAAKVFL